MPHEAKHPCPGLGISESRGPCRFGGCSKLHNPLKDPWSAWYGNDKQTEEEQRQQDEEDPGEQGDKGDREAGRKK
eukprot:15141794-Alexandrium_andersonii.AAC.2